MKKKQRQLSFATLAGTIVSAPARGRHYVEPRGYARPPGSGPAGETCGTCQHCIRFRRWCKCDRARWKWTGGRSSDILARAPACKLWHKQNALGMTDSTVLTESEFLALISEIKNP